ncbi:adenylate/guanylate cyclase domain-containing protein [Fulvivirgaceae bacterium BMA10]|uniref:Adenylate/guanylate cyclase domain-containing protein n=1 Tax=Splendidivirga corallicola TaxID=3051826 RepID=A0ABT8KM30_9BACT|nr:adenylate/guanylate cyclase domain-containing protein [Fulvivirgaceae bacterium BMA10]
MSDSIKKQFERELQIEITKSEFKRTYITMGLIFAGTILALVNYLFFRNDYDTFFGSRVVNIALFIWAAVFLVYEAIILSYLKKYRDTEREVPKWFKVMNIIDEITLPSAFILTIIILHEREIYLDSPAQSLYFIFIILSALHMDFKLSVLMGIVAAVQFAFITFYAFEIIESEEAYQVVLPRNVYYIRSFIFILSGVAAGHVGEEIKKRVFKAFENQRAKKEIEDLFGQQVSKEIVDALIQEKNQSRKVEATIMFLDIRDFTAHVEYKEPGEIIAFQNKIFEPIIDIVNQHKGIVNQILGDGIMATFGTPIEDENHAKYALQAGIKVLDRLREMVDTNEIPPTKLGIGLHSGEVVTGNIGNADRKQFSISGTPVIIASRLEQLNKAFNSEFIISEKVYLKVREELPACKSLGQQQLKGIESEMEVFRIR